MISRTFTRGKGYNLNFYIKRKSSRQISVNTWRTDIPGPRMFVEAVSPDSYESDRQMSVLSTS